MKLLIADAFRLRTHYKSKNIAPKLIHKLVAQTSAPCLASSAFSATSARTSVRSKTLSTGDLVSSECNQRSARHLNLRS
jgi:hypothetical protein